MPTGRPQASGLRQVKVHLRGYGHGGPGVCLGDCQTEAEGVTSQGGRGDALLRRMPPTPDLTNFPFSFSEYPPPPCNQTSRRHPTGSKACMDRASSPPKRANIHGLVLSDGGSRDGNDACSLKNIG